MKKILAILAIIALASIIGSGAWAHQPRIVSQDSTLVINPEISQAFYGQLQGQPAIYTINADKPFKLYLNILVPDLPDIAKNFQVQVDSDIEGAITQKAYYLESSSSNWTYFYEDFGGDSYYKGPEMRAEVPAGLYTIRVSNPGNQGKYVLAVGETESFPLSEAIKTLWILPQLKINFFNKSPLDFFNGLIGRYVGLGILSIVVIVIVVLVIVLKIKKRKK